MRKNKKIIIAIGLLIIVFFVYMSSRPKSPDSPLVTNVNTEIPTVVQSGQNAIPESILILPGSTFAIDGQTGGVVKIQDDNNVQGIYNKKTLAFTASDRFLFVLPQNTSGIIEVVDIATQKTVKSIANPQFGQIIALDYQADTNKLFVLGSYSPEKRTSTLYEITKPSEDSFQTRNVLETQSTEVKAMTNNYVALFQMKPGLDYSALSVIDAAQNKSLYTFDRMTSYQLSPDKTHLLVRTMSKIEFFSTSATDGGVKPFNVRLPSRQVVWRDNQSVIFAITSKDGVTFRTYNTKTFEPTNEFFRKLPEPIQIFLAVKENKAIIQLSSGALYELPI